LANVFPQFATAPRTVFETPKPFNGCLTEVEITLIMRPYPEAFMDGNNANRICWAFIKCWLKAFLYSSMGAEFAGPGGGPPVLLIKILATPPLSTYCWITVNNVLPGATNTTRLDSIFKGRAAKQGITPEQAAENEKLHIPARRFAEPEEFADAVAFLCSPSASYISGINLPVDGGRTTCL
jgi:hypothetical protein